VRALAERALGRGALLAEDRPGGPHVAAAIRALALADDLQSAELAAAVAVDRARESGSPDAYARVSALRADVSLRRGSLADAVADARAALEVPSASRQRTAVAALALALTEHGDFDEAAEAIEAADLHAAPAAGAAAVLCARSRLRLLRGDHEGAVADAHEAGSLVGELQADAPAWLAWRSEAAAALAPTDPEQARRLAYAEVGLARAAGAPRALGIALRSAGVAEGGDRGLGLLREAARILDGSHAALERAHTLAALGTALRAAQDPLAARRPLREALSVARRAGATVLERRIDDELAATGDRVHRAGRSDAGLLTPAERRVVDLATDGLSAGEVADALFITVKAVEWHLRSAARKLGARSRDQLLDSLSLRD
jgi:DNA-binding CsgD family transcriptional regulator